MKRETFIEIIAHIRVRSAHDNRELKDVIHLLILAGGNEIPSNHYGFLRDAGN